MKKKWSLCLAVLLVNSFYYYGQAVDQKFVALRNGLKNNYTFFLRPEEEKFNKGDPRDATYMIKPAEIARIKKAIIERSLVKIKITGTHQMELILAQKPFPAEGAKGGSTRGIMVVNHASFPVSVIVAEMGGGSQSKSSKHTSTIGVGQSKEIKIAQGAAIQGINISPDHSIFLMIKV
ncbi:MAG: hypothetical protein WBQ73_03485 [Candidatus Babeliales bacterium]